MTRNGENRDAELELLEMKRVHIFLPEEMVEDLRLMKMRTGLSVSQIARLVLGKVLSDGVEVTLGPQPSGRSDGEGDATG